MFKKSVLLLFSKSIDIDSVLRGTAENLYEKMAFTVVHLDRFTLRVFNLLQTHVVKLVLHKAPDLSSYIRARDGA